MPHQVDRGEDPRVDLDRTDELPLLDTAVYEARLDLSGSAALVRTADAAESDETDNRLPRAIALPPNDTLHDVEEWIASQLIRDRANEQALAELQASQTAAATRADRLSAELESIGSALQAALGRANASERAVLERDAAARAAEARLSELTADLGETRADLLSTTQRLAASEAELEGTRVQAEQQRGEHADLLRASDERARQIVLLAAELDTLRVRVADSERELARRAESVSLLTEASDSHAAEAAELKRVHGAIEARANTYFENLQSHEWQRSVWDSVWRDLDEELTGTQVTLARIEREHAALAATTEGLRAALTERNAIIARLEADGSAQVMALRELANARSQDEQARQTTAIEFAARNAELLATVGTLEAARTEMAALLAERESELADARSSREALETAQHSARADNAAQAARIAELEEVVVRVAQALQVQTAATQRTMALLETRDRDDHAQQAHVADLETRLAAAVEAAAERAAAAQRAETALADHSVELANSRGRVDALERDAGGQAMLVKTLETDLAKADVLAEQANDVRQVLEAELESARGELARTSEHVGSLETQHRELALELETARSALEERELLIRRLERHAAVNAEALGRIKFDIERAAYSPDAGPQEAAAALGALVSLDGDAAGMRVLKRRTTIGRAPDNDVSLTESSISRHHAVILVGSNASFIEDLKSANGVAVNGRRIRQARLTEGDVITLGTVRFRFTRQAGANAEAC